MHPPLKIIDQTDELIAIEWLREQGYDSYADHMEADLATLLFPAPLWLRETDYSIFTHFFSCSISYFGNIQRRSQSYSLSYTRSFNSSRIRSLSGSRCVSRERSAVQSTQSPRPELSGSNSISRSRTMRHLYR